MKHLNEEDLVLVHYGEPGAPDGARAHVDECGDCRRELQALQAALALAERGLDDTPEPSADFEQRTWERLAPRLVPRRASAFWPRTRAAWGALAAALLLAFLVGRYAPGPAPAPASLPVQVRERILFVAIGDHLERSRTVLLELTNADPSAPADLRFERRSAEALVGANRLYRQAAQRSGDTSVANVLDELERVLIDVAHRPDELAPAELAELQRRIAERGLLLKVQVLDQRLKSVERPPAPVASARVMNGRRNERERG